MPFRMVPRTKGAAQFSALRVPQLVRRSQGVVIALWEPALPTRHLP
jgi:hypothetical protein